MAAANENVSYIDVWPGRQQTCNSLGAEAYGTGQTTEYTEMQPLLSGVQSVMRVKLVLASEGGGVHAHPLSLHLPSPVKLQ